MKRFGNLTRIPASQLANTFYQGRNIGEKTIASCAVSRKAPKNGTLAAERYASTYASARSLAFLAGAGVVAVPSVVAGPALALVGFTANGIAADSLASGLQSLVGNVAADGVFATLQSAAMGGYGVALVYGTVRFVGAAVAGGVVMIGRSKPKEPNFFKDDEEY